MDETNHPFTTDIYKGGTRSISYGCDKIDREDRRGTRRSRLTTNVYAINSRGGVLPPFYIFDSSSQHSSNYQVQSGRCGTRSISYGCDKIDRKDRRGTR